VRLKKIAYFEEVESLKNLETQVSEPARTKIIRKMESDKRELNELRHRAWEVDDQQGQAKQKVKCDLMRMEAERKQLEQRAKVWQSLLARELVASVVGSILLLVLTLALIVAMFMGIPTTEIIGNAFLVLLGYFFGHRVSRKSGGPRPDRGGKIGKAYSLGIPKQ
jgi:membrane-bound ClpP family serine protease